MPQLAPSHVATPFAGVGHGVQDVPQLSVDVVLTHFPAHSFVPVGQIPTEASAMFDGAHEGQHCPGSMIGTNPGGQSGMPHLRPAHGSAGVQIGQH
jgi:hypothetical protein